MFSKYLCPSQNVNRDVSPSVCAAQTTTNKYQRIGASMLQSYCWINCDHMVFLVWFLFKLNYNTMFKFCHSRSYLIPCPLDLMSSWSCLNTDLKVFVLYLNVFLISPIYLYLYSSALLCNWVLSNFMYYKRENNRMPWSSLCSYLNLTMHRVATINDIRMQCCY